MVTAAPVRPRVRVMIAIVSNAIPATATLSPTSSIRGHLAPAPVGTVQAHGEGPKVAVRTADAKSTQPAWVAAGVPFIRARSAVTRWLTGFTFTKARSQPGMVAGLTKTLLANVNGSCTAKLMTVTAWADLSARPSAVQIHDTLKAKAR